MLHTLLFFLTTCAYAQPIRGTSGVTVGTAGGDLTGTYPNPTIATARVKVGGDAMTGSLTMASGSTITVIGNSFSVGTSTFVVTSGNVGIGTESPASSLDVRGTIRSGTFANPPSGSGSSIEMGVDGVPQGIVQVYNRTGGVYLPLSVDALYHYFRVSGTEKMRIDTGGNVGIGTPNPVVTLDVAGGVGLFSRTIAQLQAITPSAVGQIYFCNNCSPTKIVVSTGIAVSNFADAVGGTFK